MTEAIARLRALYARIDDLNAAADVLEWDQEVYMPDGAAAARAEQIATLRRLAHEFGTTGEIGDLLDALEPEVASLPPESFDASLVRVGRRDFEKAVRVPAGLVADLAQAVGLARQAWKQARETSDFPTFAPHLARIVDLNRRKAEALGYADRLYDALLDQYEPEMTTAEVEQVFASLRAELVPLVQAGTAAAAPDDAFLHRPYDPDRQWSFGLAVARDFGYDLTRGRQDLSAHPFTTAFATTDVRITTRVHPHFLPTALFGTLHETGHALYEQGIDPALDRTPLAEGTSLGVHESQSRLWENLVGRSRAFWSHYYPRLQALFPEELADVGLDRFYRAINRVRPSLIRVEADELTYNLHIMVRFELENAMLEGRVPVEQVPALWNDRMEEYLGVRPANDAEGVLQDIHWAIGALGYFPTYALGNLMSAQLYAAAAHEIVDLDTQIAGGHFEALLAWMRHNVHQHGRKFTARELLLHATGEPLTARHWLDYVRRKYAALRDASAA